MAVCVVVALMKFFKVTFFRFGVILMGSLLGVEMVVGLFVHFGLGISYNNYVINLFQNPIILVLPSLTPQLYRRCAWLPITAVLFPGLVLSRLYRFSISSMSSSAFFSAYWYSLASFSFSL